MWKRIFVVKRIIMNCFFQGFTPRTVYTLNSNLQCEVENRGEGNPISVVWEFYISLKISIIIYQVSF